jgi:hypothetical protein
MILLPRWKEILDELAVIAAATDKKPLSICNMPQDVLTRWNSTYNMLKFAYQYREAIDKITDDCAMDLSDYQLSESEWDTVNQHCKSLKVRIFIFFFHNYSTDLII